MAKELDDSHARKAELEMDNGETRRVDPDDEGDESQDDE